MDFLKIMNAIIVSIGFPAIIVAAIYIGRKLQILESLDKAVEKIPFK